MKKLISTIVIILCATMGYTQEFQKLEKNGVKLEWKAKGVSLTIRVSASTLGWVAVGIDPSTKMKDADYIIGYVKDGIATVEDQFGDTPYSHKRDKDLGGKDSILMKAGSEKNGVTTLTFSILLDSGDTYDKKIVAGKKYTVIVAYGSADSMTMKHSGLVVFTDVILKGADATSTATPKKGK